MSIKAFGGGGGGGLCECERVIQLQALVCRPVVSVSFYKNKPRSSGQLYFIGIKRGVKVKHIYQLLLWEF